MILYLQVDVVDESIRPHGRMNFIAGPFDSEEKRRHWRWRLDTAIGLLNRELDLGWMGCISPEFWPMNEMRPVEDARSSTPEDVVAQIRQIHDESKAIFGEDRKEN